MYGEVPDNNVSLVVLSIVLYIFWDPQAKSTSIKITPTFMITIRNLSLMEDVFKYWEVPDNNCSTQHKQQQQPSQVKLIGPIFQSWLID